VLDTLVQSGAPPPPPILWRWGHSAVTHTHTGIHSHLTRRRQV